MLNMKDQGVQANNYTQSSCFTNKKLHTGMEMTIGQILKSDLTKELDDISIDSNDRKKDTL